MSGVDNIADRTTRLHSIPEDFGFDSEWFLGPAYVKLPMKEWPVNRDFADRKGAVKLPKEEIRKVCSAGMGVVGPGSLDNPVLDPDLLRGGQAGQYPAPLDEGEGHDGYVGIQTGKVMYPVVSDNVRKRYVRDRGRLVYQGAGQ